jgi:hypothetical protein
MLKQLIWFLRCCLDRFQDSWRPLVPVVEQGGCWLLTLNEWTFCPFCRGRDGLQFCGFLVLFLAMSSGCGLVHVFELVAFLTVPELKAW